MEPGYQALRESCGWLDLAGRGLIRMTGEDRARLLHALSTNHIQQLQPGQGCYAFFLNAQGRILADVNVLCRDSDFLLDVEPESRRFVYEHLDKYIIADDVTLEDWSESMAALGLEGPQAQQALGDPGSLILAPWSVTGAPGFRAWVPAADKAALIARWEAAGAVPASAAAANSVRLERGTPRFPEDLANRLPHETQALHGVHFSKGCYLGQEIVERVRSRGLVHHLLVKLQIQSGQAPESGAKILAEGAEAGEITSAAFSPALGLVAALGYLRRELIRPGAALSVGGAAAELVL